MARTAVGLKRIKGSLAGADGFPNVYYDASLRDWRGRYVAVPFWLIVAHGPCSAGGAASHSLGVSGEPYRG